MRAFDASLHTQAVCSYTADAFTSRLNKDADAFASTLNHLSWANYTRPSTVANLNATRSTSENAARCTSYCNDWAGIRACPSMCQSTATMFNGKAVCAAGFACASASFGCVSYSVYHASTTAVPMTTTSSTSVNIGVAVGCSIGAAVGAAAIGLFCYKKRLSSTHHDHYDALAT
ncbi:hypothetical protein SPRG_00394 [Saprolegnia parasitica CBS 223.65]|uniref:Uncharacterized protein n=1 Tax=Saprolegnia parasitica (strain CBS 223.65) TaxID=695850 RepID=A0A067CXW5_SAPPC|nr:hypothetical protein SPRG_00394 [Saprolegnia parasitica CBS 223.65]KDO35549.1 hypothetical protein SPRG_00394 [Saprolegnia parasitica CBS 223.65]|eukprot:XP_012193883.1 hypothetical protein SPRG_00394 [Saprolegnia parasitica CBS 223.65]